ncbi:MAG: hypothetical protein JWO38_2573 [Gemmataceae bacterium]|nr:hypothetical protein [Gemmataceae bacterium]
MPNRSRVLRVLLVFVLVVPLILVVFGPSSSGPSSSPPVAPKETDLQRVYARLSEGPLYQHLRTWCGLRVSEANPEEATRLRTAVEAAPDPQQVWCSPLDEIRRAAPPRTYKFPDGIRWYRLSHPTDQDRWIGIGVFEHHNTGWTAYWIRCRIPVGFEPSAEPDTAPDRRGL